MKPPILYIVIPCYNEEAVIRETAKRVAMKMQQLYDRELISEKSKVLFVDDAGQTHIHWQNNSTLACIHGIDRFRKIEG